MRNRDLPAPWVWLGACLATGLGASAAVQASPAKPVKWVVTCPAPKPREAARPEADAVAQAAEDAEAASPEAPAPVPTRASAAPVQDAPLDVGPVPQPLPSLVPRQPQEPGPTVAAPLEGAARPATEPEGNAEAPAAQRVSIATAATPRSLEAGPALAAAQHPVSMPAVQAAPTHLALAAATAAPATVPAAVPAAAPSAVPPAPLAGDPQRWDVRIADVTLAKTLARWAQEAGYRLQWDAARNYLISAPSTFIGAFEDAVAQALGTPGVRSGDYPLEACLYANTPPLIRVTRQGDQVRECVAVSP